MHYIKFNVLVSNIITIFMCDLQNTHNDYTFEKKTWVLNTLSAAQSNMIKMASKKLQHFGNFNLFDMSDNIRTGYLSVHL